ncbi:valine--tRNA ligase [Alphaproteobacteria bacterium endosymbiont of Tiliacea citrago]|uniref:valine--tRNA ligase n=1 Tax=Alphaproteobacteria bacterium endosymbiont of Tiliacea citrago TaxID=3077944 RepID=UPI00313F2009
MKNFITLLPPPNITGSLHIGHYFNWALQDFLIQYKKAKGYKTEWILGLDHAGIATQYVVERKLAEKGESRKELGREKFNEKIQEWKIEAEELIQKQVDNFKFDMNWNVRHFTMDEDHQKRVREAFVKLYKDGLIEKKLKITNWDTKCKTAISDLEVIEKVEKSKIYIIEYKAENKEEESLYVATTRPETIFADVALCLNPEDPRAKKLEGKKFLIPLINKAIPVILDELCQADKGLGVLKVTPAHDSLDNEIGEKHKLELISIINEEGKLYNTIKELDGLTIEEAKKEIIKIFKENQINYEEKEWEGIKKYTEKSGVPLEMILTEQWFLDVSTMAKQALENIEEVKFYPEYLKNTFKNWMINIKPWCISRQIWWGHQLPIWYTKEGEIICETTKEEAANKAKVDKEELKQETDVLDTWFSSALWANLTEEKIDVLITGKDILFFWVARMIMFSLYLYNKNPFKKLYFNGIVRDKNNEKMSKTKGNVINPIELNEKYGEDALRFTLLKNTAGNKDIKLNEKEVELSRNFITKIRNAETFLTKYMNKNYKENENLDSWIETKIFEYKQEIETNIEEYEFQKAAELFYDLMWNHYCNWYIEGLKENPSTKAINYFYEILKIGQPFLPLTIEKILPKENKKITITKKETNFEKVIKITKFLRKIKKHSDIKTFYIEFEEKLIENYTKIKNEKTSNFAIILEQEKIFIEKEHIEKVKEAIEKENKELEKERLELTKKIETAKSVPNNIVEEWKNRNKNTEEKLEEINQLKKLIK